jgi:heat-inducible transcriptional repressor
MAARKPITSTQAETVPDARGRFVLGEIIREHLRTGEPVGSKAVAERCANSAGWSPATIRNVMAELEGAGLVQQPHTSAGRVPTDKGYRFYVDHIVGAARLSRNDLDAVERAIGAEPTESGPAAQGRLMERVSHLLSELSENVGIVVSPPLAESRLQHIEFVALADGRVLAVMVFAPNVVHNRVVRVNEPLAQDELESAARYLNTEFTGKSLNAIRAELLRAVLAEKVLYDRLLRNAVLLCGQSLDGGPEDAGEVYVDGASNILSKPDFSDLARLRELFRTLEEKSRLIELLNECVGRELKPTAVSVRIGRELAAPAMQACALITAPYRLGAGSGFGALGVFGPMRIEYARTMAVVNYVAQRVERVLGEGGPLG